MSQGEHNFDELHFEPAPALSGEVPGPLSREMLAEQDELESSARSYPRSVPVAIESGRGATMRDVDGNTFIDFFGGAGVLNVGHNHPAVARAAAEQQQKLVHALDFPTRPKLRLMRKLKSLLPGRLRESARFHFGGPTGSDAIESALKLTRAHTGRDAVIAFQGSYHGMTTGALSVTSDVGFGGPTSSPVHFMPYPYCYRCPLGLKPDSCELACAKLLDTSLEDPHSGIPEPAAILIEPIQGEGGTIVPPDGYLREVRRIASKHQVPLICDEIQTGFARTGTMFACEHDSVTPDVMTLSKALGGIGYPLSCIAYDMELDGWKPGAHIGTFRGHQVAMAAGFAAIELMQEVDLAGHAAALGELALELLREAQDGLPSVGDVRGRGLMIGIELVRDRDTKEPWPEMAGQIRRECFRKGVIIEVGGHFGNVARFLPPLVITRELLLTGVEIFLESVRLAEQALAQPSALLAG
ncbi:MAG TPA: aspartate aminotransferase family protein [Solirubrobacteraceae bacterium]|jgi:diaminobutyrate-2-oxoglutarate transaminase|nr:aspartate aminotransferase family protein [Solirubrobacteraceae bacterium]